MKITLSFYSFLVLFLACFKLSYSQTNVYLQNNPSWGITSLCAEPYPCINNRQLNYYTNGDTVINSLLYKKIMEKGKGFYSWNAPPPSNCQNSGSYTYVNSSASYFIRSNNKQMFVRGVFDLNEQLLYDFNLSVGDSLPLSYNNFDSHILVTAIDSFITPFGYRKRFTLSGNTWAQYLIEGVGTNKGLVESLQIGFDCGYDLTCYGLNNISYYPSSAGPTCELSVGLKEIRKPINYNVYPNPFITTVNIQFEETIEYGELELYNMYGQKVKSSVIQSSNSALVTRDGLDLGIYCLYLKQNNQCVSLGKISLIE